MRELIAEREWLTTFLFPPIRLTSRSRRIWAHVKRSLTNLAVASPHRLETFVRNRLKRLQCQPDTLDSVISGTGLTIDTPNITLTSRSRQLLPRRSRCLGLSLTADRDTDVFDTCAAPNPRMDGRTCCRRRPFKNQLPSRSSAGLYWS